MPEVRVVVSEELDRYMDTIVRKGLFGSKAELIRAALMRYIETLPVRVPSGYDTDSIFSPDGRIFQVEYAIECAKRGSTIVGLRYKGGAILAKQKPKPPKEAGVPYTVSAPWEDFEVDQHVGVVSAGLASDFILLKDKAVKEAQAYRREYGEPISVEELTRRLSLFMHSHTLRVDVRPLGCILLIGGVDKSGCRLFILDASGAYREVKAGSAGSGVEKANKVLSEGYSPEMPFMKALTLTVKALLEGEKDRGPDRVVAVVVEEETGVIRRISSKELEEALKTAFGL